MLSQVSWDLTANQEQEQWVQWVDTVADPHFQELELSHSNFIYKGVASLLPSTVTVRSCSNKGEDGEDHINQKQSSKDSILIYLYITT